MSGEQATLVWLEIWSHLGRTDNINGAANERRASSLHLKIVQVGEPVLREVSRTLTKEEILSDKIQSLTVDMRETMHAAPGVGLATPQIGLPLQLAVIEDKEEYCKDIAAEELRERERQP